VPAPTVALAYLAYSNPAAALEVATAFGWLLFIAVLGLAVTAGVGYLTVRSGWAGESIGPVGGERSGCVEEVRE
jgi:hypothetical protein